MNGTDPTDPLHILSEPFSPLPRVFIGFNNLEEEGLEQTDLFTDPKTMSRDRRLQAAALEIQEKYGKNALLKGMNLEKAATTTERNEQIGGHRSGFGEETVIHGAG